MYNRDTYCMSGSLCSLSHIFLAEISQVAEVMTFSNSVSRGIGFLFIKKKLQFRPLPLDTKIK